MRKQMGSVLSALVAIVALAVSPAAFAATKKTPTPAPAAAAAADTKADKTEKVNLNTADEKTIAGAKGVGDKLAKELVAGRPYKTWAEVSKVKGVGEGKKLDSLKKVLKLSGGEAAKEEPVAKDTKAKKSKSSSKGDEAAGAGASGKAAASSEPSSPSKKSSSSSSSSSEKAEAPKLAPGTKININTASKEQLDALPEIGPVKAQAIVDYRNANGKFATPEDIMKVPGIKEGTFAKIKEYVVVR